MNKKRHDVTVAGVKVTVHFDGDGQPLTATASLERPDDREHERLVALATTHVHDAAVTAARTSKRKNNSAAAAKASAKKRAEVSEREARWANKWLAKADAEHPGCGKGRLMLNARRLAAAAGFKLAKRDRISEWHTAQYLKRHRNQKKTGS